MTDQNITTSGIACWNCDGIMKRYGQDSFYWYYNCPLCGMITVELKDDYPGKTKVRDAG